MDRPPHADRREPHPGRADAPLTPARRRVLGAAVLGSLRDVIRSLEGPLAPDDRVDAPSGGTIFPHALQRPTRAEAAARFTDIRHWSEPERAGHFPALGQPDTFAAKLTELFALVR